MLRETYLKSVYRLLGTIQKDEFNHIITEDLFKTEYKMQRKKD